MAPEDELVFGETSTGVELRALNRASWFGGVSSDREEDGPWL